ncbi:hypothetical protein L7F22_063711 [Adiantum nelumboides]|nr:hypothetical protein [Adiantum nelumboides]
MARPTFVKLKVITNNTTPPLSLPIDISLDAPPKPKKRNQLNWTEQDMAKALKQEKITCLYTNAPFNLAPQFGMSRTAISNWEEGMPCNHINLSDDPALEMGEDISQVPSTPTHNDIKDEAINALNDMATQFVDSLYETHGDLTSPLQDNISPAQEYVGHANSYRQLLEEAKECFGIQSPYVGTNHQVGNQARNQAACSNTMQNSTMLSSSLGRVARKE